jgi:hypothetical protein
MKSSKQLARLLLGTALVVAPNAAWADDDSSADASGGYTEYVKQSEAVVIKVPINERGEELVEAAEMRTYAGDAVTSSDNVKIKAAFEVGETIEGTPQLSDGDISRDSSTWGWRGWHGRHGYNYGYNYGYYNNYYYNYSPSYYGGGGYYNYGSPYYYDNYNYGGGSYYGYRYYYYPRC